MNESENQLLDEPESRLAIYIATHKKYFFFDEAEFIPIQVGKALSHSDLGFIGDDSGENISRKNKEFCELTALYWIWKNASADFLGLYHYRRYLGRVRDNRERVLKPKEIKEILTTENVILVPDLCSIEPYSVREHYDVCHHIEDWDKLKQVVQELYPDYIDSFNKIEKQHQMHITNIMIAHRSFVDKYCQWLFNILFRLESIVDIDKYDDYQKRIFGFLSERLFNVFIEKHRSEYKIISLSSVSIPIQENL